MGPSDKARRAVERNRSAEERKRKGQVQCFRTMGFFGWRYYFRLVAGNGEIILPSEGYNSAAARDHGLAVARELLADAPRVDV